MKHPRSTVLVLPLLIGLVGVVLAQTVANDPLVRMPGTQPAQGVSLESPNRCLNCHADYAPNVEPGHNWMGSMMAQSARDPLFWACLTVAAQDSHWASRALGVPLGQGFDAVDICERCHFPAGWLQGRSDPPNASAMTGADYDGVSCDMCHRMYDPFHVDTWHGTREGSNWRHYWDEAGTLSQPAADQTLLDDRAQASQVRLFNGAPFFGADSRPASPLYTENASGQYFVSAGNQKRASFADAAARHQMLYSRYHKSRYFCATCHDVSNPVLANWNADPSQPLPTEERTAHSYFHVERTFSEFMLSAYGRNLGGAPGEGPFAPHTFVTSNQDNWIARCQDCHMRDVVGRACNKNGVPLRPNESAEHPRSGQPLHDLTGGNAWVPFILASSVAGSPNYRPVNDALLNQGPGVLTLDLTQGLGLNPTALLDGASRALQQLQLAASISHLNYASSSGVLSFLIRNQTGHKLPSGFPEGRRIFVNIVVRNAAGSPIRVVNPWDPAAGTLKGLPYTYYDPATGQTLEGIPLAPGEEYVDQLVYEMHPGITDPNTGEVTKTFHFVLADTRYKDNRIPPKGFDIAGAAARLAQPVYGGADSPGYFAPEEYQGGYDSLELNVGTGGAQVEVSLYYQTTSREYIEFLRNEIKGEGPLTLPPLPGLSNPYIVQQHPFFAQLRSWGDTIWQLWTSNLDVAGAAPVLMARAVWPQPQGPVCDPPEDLSASAGNRSATLAWQPPAQGDRPTHYRVYYDQAGKTQFRAELQGSETTYTDSGLTNGIQYCYVVTSVVKNLQGSTSCESDASNVACAIPAKGGGGGKGGKGGK